MNKHWSDFLFGQVQVKIIGKQTDQLLNDFLANDISVWEIKTISQNCIVCSIRLEDVRKVRSLLKQQECKLRFIDRKGVPFLLRRMSLKSGFVIGMALFATVLFVLSNMIWDIEVNGADPQVEHEIRQVLDDLNIERGKFQFLLPSPESIQYEMIDRLDKVTWIGAKLRGTTYVFEVVEKEVPEEEKALTPRNLIAEKEAVIVDYYVEQGKPKIEINDHVEKGDMLVTGTTGEGDNQRTVPAKGKVFGETWYTSTVTVPLESTFTTYTGRTHKKHQISVFGFDIPIWGFGDTDYKKYNVASTNRPLHFLKWELPIEYKTKKFLETDQVTRTYTKKEALQTAKKMAKNDLQEKLGKKVVIKAEKVLRQTIDNGKVKVLIHYTVIENIATGQPIIQGD